MGVQLHCKRACLIFSTFSFLLITSLPVFADSVSDARKGSIKAMDDYYRAVRATPGMSPSQKRDLKKTIVEPASMKFNQAIQDRNKANDGPPTPLKFRKITDPKEIKEREAKRAKRFDKLMKFSEARRKGLPDPKLKGDKDDSGSVSPADQGLSGGRFKQDTSPARPEEVLDGSGVKKEIEFGKKKKKNAPSKIPSRK